jgi:hypothetical protein
LLIIILPLLQDIEPASIARTISYNIAGPISALGYQSPTLVQLMARYATLDPVLTRPASDKRKIPSLIAPPAAKKKRTSKKLLIQVRTPSLPKHKAILHPDHLSSCAISDQNSATIGHYRVCQCSTYW